MSDNLTKRICDLMDRIESIPEGRRGYTLRRIALLLLEAFEFPAKTIESLLLIFNDAKATPPLPEDVVAGIARSAAEEAKKNFSRLMSGIVCLGNIPANEYKTAMRMIDALPYDYICCIAEGDAKSLHWKTTLTKLQSDLINYEFDKIHCDAMSTTDVGVSIEGTREINGVTTMKFTEGDTPQNLPMQIEEILTVIAKSGILRPRKRHGGDTTDSSAESMGEE